MASTEPGARVDLVTVTPKFFGTLAAVCGFALAILWGIVGGNTSLVATLVALAVIALAAWRLDDE